jgi:hypothetical protein
MTFYIEPFIPIHFAAINTLQFGAGKRRVSSPASPLPLGSPGGCSSKKTFLKKEKFFEKTWGNT